MEYNSVSPARGFDGFDGFEGSQEAEKGGPWPTPRPLAGALAAVPALDPELLPQSLRARVIDLAERFQAPADYAAAALIVMLAGALGRRALIRPKRHDDWVVYGNLWGAIVRQVWHWKEPGDSCGADPLAP